MNKIKFNDKVEIIGLNLFDNSYVPESFVLEEKDEFGGVFYNCIRLSDPYISDRSRNLFLSILLDEEITLNAVGSKLMEIHELTPLDEIELKKASPTLWERVKSIFIVSKDDEEIVEDEE